MLIFDVEKSILKYSFVQTKKVHIGINQQIKQMLIRRKIHLNLVFEQFLIFVRIYGDSVEKALRNFSLGRLETVAVFESPNRKSKKSKIVKQGVFQINSQQKKNRKIHFIDFWSPDKNIDFTH